MLLCVYATGRSLSCDRIADYYADRSSEANTRELRHHTHNTPDTVAPSSPDRDDDAVTTIARLRRRRRFLLPSLKLPPTDRHD